jgi:hypothetical protein
MLESIRNTVSLTPHIPLPIGVSALTAIVVVGVVLFNWPHQAQTPTIATAISADSFTVESARVDDAVESLKRILPGMQGEIRNVSNESSEKVFAVVIPQERYANLTTELVNYGALASGAGGPDRRPRKDGSNVILYIRFVPAH